jgi:DNA invertase Pin-like site-specific DNA recombinase
MSELQGLRVVGYARHSTKSQEDSAEQQIEGVGRLVQRHGLDLACQPFADRAVRGWDDKGQAGFRALTEFVRQQHQLGTPVRGIVIWAQKRLGRKHALKMAARLEPLCDLGVRYLIEQEGVTDLGTAMGRMTFLMKAEMAAEDNRIRALDSARGKLEQSKSRHVVSCPFGFRPVREPHPHKPCQLVTTDWAEHEGEAPVVRRIFKSFATGRYSFRSLAKELNDEGVMPPSVARKRRDQRPKWSTSSVRAILKNPAYLGHQLLGRRTAGQYAGVIDLDARFRPEGEEGKVIVNPEARQVRGKAHPALIDQETWGACQRVMAANGAAPGRRTAKRVYVFSGLLLCAKCGRGMGGKVQKGTPCYVCSGFVHSRTCDANRVNEARLLNALAEWLQERLKGRNRSTLADAVRLALAAEADGGKAPDASKGRLDTLADEIKLAERNLARARSDDDFRAVSEQLRSLRAENSRLQASAAAQARREALAAEQVEELVSAALKVAEDLVQVFRQTDPEAVRAFLAEHVERIDVHFLPACDHKGKERYVRSALHLKEGSPLLTILAPQTSICDDAGTSSARSRESR